MSPVLTTTPLRVRAAIITEVLAMKHKYELPSVAHHFDLTLIELQALLNHYGYPDTARMRAAAVDLERRALEEQAEDAAAPAGDVDDEEVSGPGDILLTIPVNKLTSDPDNPRENLTGIEDLADSIKSVGLLQPIIVRKVGDRYIIVAGHRRAAAIRLLKWDVVQVVVKAKLRADHVLAAMLIENGQRTDLDPIEEARGLFKLKHAQGLSDVELARMVGRSQPTVSARLSLLDLTPDEQAAVRAGEMKIVEATFRARSNSGRHAPKGQTKGWHLAPDHPLADRVKARCTSLGHPKGRTVGGMGCGDCWETVIRTDERAALMRSSTEQGQCPTCGTEAS